MKKTWMALAIAASIITPAAYAQDASQPGWYGDLGYSRLSYKTAGSTWSNGGVTATVGYSMGSNWGIEGQFTNGMSDDTQTLPAYPTIPVTIKIKAIGGIYVVGKANLAPSFQVFGRLGTTTTSIDLNVNGSTSLKDSSSGSDIAYGAGIRYNFTPKVSATLDYMSYYNKESVTVSGYTFGLGYKF